MKAEVLNAFLDAAKNALTTEAHANVQRTGLYLDPSDSITDEYTVYVALVGEVRGLMLIGMAAETARGVASEMIGEPLPELNELGLSALAELGNLVAGGATVGLERLALACDITPPTLMIGRRSRISTLGLRRFVIPLKTRHGPIRLHVAVDLMPTAGARPSPGQ